MPRLEAHLRASQENQDLAATLISTPGGVSWAPVVAFYAALHLVDAYLATIGVHPMSHVERRAAIRQTRVLAPILRDYRILEAMSRESRYDLRRFSAAEASSLLASELTRVRDGIESLLG
jgi:hypothetical protein